MLVAASAAPAFGDDYALVGAFEVVDELAGFRVEERGADGDLEGDGVAVLAGAVGAHAVLAALALVLGVVAEVDEGVVALGADHDDVAAAASVAAGGTATGDELFAAEGHAAVAAVAGFYANFGFIDEHGKDRDSGTQGLRDWPWPRRAGWAESFMPSFQFTGLGLLSLATSLLGL